jgi:hypothetical protein
MSDELHRTIQQVAHPPADAHASQGGDGFPSEPFACPHCGQMLGPKVRVCVACRQPIDSAAIKVRAAAPEQSFRPAGSQDAAPPRPKARFSWGIFIAVMLAVLALLTVTETKLGAQKTLYVYWGVQLLSTAWVFFDARQKGIPRPMRWAIATLLIWLPFFSWYLARRRQPNADCTPMEGDSRPFLRVLLLVTAVTLLAALLFAVLASSLHLPVPK